MRTQTCIELHCHENMHTTLPSERLYSTLVAKVRSGMRALDEHGGHRRRRTIASVSLSMSINQVGSAREPSSSAVCLCANADADADGGNMAAPRFICISQTHSECAYTHRFTCVHIQSTTTTTPKTPIALRCGVPELCQLRAECTRYSGSRCANRVS